MTQPPGVNVDGVCRLAWNINTHTRYFTNLSFTQYSSTPLFASIINSSAIYTTLFHGAFGNTSLHELPTVMASLHHTTKDTSITRASLAIACTMLAAVLLRVYSRLRLVPGRLKGEDWMVIFGALWTIPLAALTHTLYMTAGSGRHLYDVTPHENTTQIRLFYFILLFYPIAITLVRLSFLSYFAGHPSSTRGFRIVCWGVGVAIAIAGVVFFASNVLSCSPIDYWNHPGVLWRNCPHRVVRGDVRAGFAVVADVIVILMGISVVVTMAKKGMLKMGDGDRAGLVGLFVLAVVISVIPLLRIFSLRSYETSADYTVYAPRTMFLFVSEPALAIILSSLPSIRALVIHFVDAYSSASNHLSHLRGETRYTGEASPPCDSTAGMQKPKWRWSWGKKRQSQDLATADIEVQVSDVTDGDADRVASLKKFRFIHRATGSISSTRSWVRKSFTFKAPTVVIPEPANDNTTAMNNPDITESYNCDADVTDVELGVSPTSHPAILCEKFTAEETPTLSTPSSPYSSNTYGPPGPPPLVPLPDLPQRPLTPSTASSMADYEIERQRSRTCNYNYEYNEEEEESYPNNFRFSDPLPSADEGVNRERERVLCGQERSMSVPDSGAELRRLGSSGELKGLSPRPAPRKT